MNKERIASALRAASDTRCFLFGDNILNKVDSVFGECFGSKKAVIIADQNTYKVVGEAVRASISTRLAAEPLIFPGQPTLYADFNNVSLLENQLSAFDAVPVVLGSGTLNDITKLAAHRLGRPYMVVATAASMDGYTSFGAAITQNGFKQTISCPAPRGIVADLQVLAKAPARMNSTGYGDLLGKLTAGADWIVADGLEIEPIEPVAWSLVQDSLQQWTGHPASLQSGDPEAIENLFEGLIMSGLAMQNTKTSRPASGSEHQFSHLWEMQAIGHGKPEHPHGFKVGIGTIASAALYEQLFAHDLTRLDVDNLCQKWPSIEEVVQKVRASFDIPALIEKAVEECSAKYITPEMLRQRLTLLKQRWPSLREKLKTQLKPAVQVREQLQLAGCPTDPAEIGLNLVQLRQSYFQARYIRRRYTVLDLAFETGLLEDCVGKLFKPGGFWPTHSKH